MPEPDPPAFADHELVTDVTRERDTLTLKLGPTLTLEHAAPLRERLRAILDAHEDASAAAVDLSGVDEISSAALGVLVVFCKEFGCERGRMALAGANEHVARLIEMTGLDGVFTVVDDLGAAVRGLFDGGGAKA